MYSNVIQQMTYPLIERLTGKPFEQYIRETVLQPIGMENTVWSVEAAGQEMALGHQLRYTSEGVDARLMRIKCEHDKLGKVCGMASLRMITTIGDVVRAQMVCYPGPTTLMEKAKLLRHLKEHPLFAEMSQPLGDLAQSVREVDAKGSEIPGSGTLNMKIGEYVLSGHHGACAGFRAHIVRVPELKFGVGILTNSSEGLNLAHWAEAWMIGQLTGNEVLADSVHAQWVDRRVSTRVLTFQD